MNRIWRQCCEPARRGKEQHHRREQKIEKEACFVEAGLGWRKGVKGSMDHHEDLVLLEASPTS